jgi:hypothetical protein
MHFINEKKKSLELRAEGYSYNYISRKLDVPKSTLSNWLKDLSFIPNKITSKAIINSQQKAISASRSDRIISLVKAREYAEQNIKNLSSREILLIGMGIYIGEGSKAYNTTRIVNSDPRIIKFSLLWLKKCFGLSDENIKIRIHIYPDNDEKKTLEFWMNQLNLKKYFFQTFYIDRRINKRKNRAGILPYGTAHMSVISNGNKKFGVLLHRKILATIDCILNKRD